MNESEKQFSFTRAALSTCGRAKSKFLSAKVKSCCSEGESPSNEGQEGKAGRQQAAEEASCEAEEGEAAWQVTPTSTACMY